MAKKLTSVDKWKSQRWFRLLDPYHKLAWEYLHAICDVDGTWQINILDLVDDLRIPPGNFDVRNFAKCCNIDFDIMSGQPIECHRVLIIGQQYLWFTGYISLQQEGNELKTVNPTSNFTRAALMRLAAKGALNEALVRGFIPLTIPLQALPLTPARPLEGALYISIDKEKDKEIIQLLYDINEKKGGAGERRTRRVKTGATVGETPDLPVGEVPPPMTEDDFKEFGAKLMVDHMFVEPLMIGRGIKDEKELLVYLNLFNAHIAGEEKLNKDYKMYKSHFKNWIGTQDTSNGPPKTLRPRNGTAHAQSGFVIPTVTAADVNKYRKTVIHEH